MYCRTLVPKHATFNIMFFSRQYHEIILMHNTYTIFIKYCLWDRRVVVILRRRKRSGLSPKSTQKHITN